MGHISERSAQSRVVRIAKPQERNTDLRIRTVEALLQYEKIKLSATTIAETWLDSVEAQNSQLADSVAIMRSSLPLLQSDTLGEMSAAFKLYKDKDTNLGGVRSGLMLFSTFEDLAEEDYGRFSLALLTANLFNREDEKIETALGSGASVKEGNFLERVLENGVATMVNIDGTNTRITPHDYLIHLNRLVEHEGLDDYGFRKRVDTIVAAQHNGMKMLESDHTPLQAAQYKLATVGVYQQLLANLFFEDDERIHKYAYYAMNFQLADDEDDIRDDVAVQPNPFVSLLRKYGLLSEYMSSKLNFKKFLKMKQKELSYDESLELAVEMATFERVYYSADGEAINEFLETTF